LSAPDIDFKSSIVNRGIGVTVAVAVGGTGVRVAAGVGGSPTGEGTGVRTVAQPASRMTNHRDRTTFITTSLLRILSHKSRGERPGIREFVPHSWTGLPARDESRRQKRSADV